MPDRLPPLRRRLLQAYVLIVVVFMAAVGGIMAMSLRIQADISPRILDESYGSIIAVRGMRQAWDLGGKEGSEAFERGVALARFHISEPGERDLVDEADALGKRRGGDPWVSRGPRAPKADLDADFDRTMNQLLHINEVEMFRMAKNASAEAERSVGYLLGVFGATLALTLLFARRLANSLALPLIRIADELKRPRSLDEPLDLGPSDSREMEVLRLQLQGWWEHERSLQRLNVGEIIARRNQLEAVFASVEDGVILLDGNGALAQLNARAARLLEIDAAVATGRDLRELAQANENGRRLLKWMKGPAAEGSEAPMLLEGRTRLFALRRRDIPATEGRAAQSLLLMQDVTERRQRERLENEFIGVLSHELKTPLQSLGTAVELLARRKGSLDPSVHIFIETMLDDLRRIRAVANDFMQVSQLDVRSIRLKLEDLDLGEKMKEWARPFELLASEKEVLLILALPQGGAACRLDPVKFSWVVSNLLSNALRVSRAKQIVKVTVEAGKDGVDLVVEDEGPGIAEEVQSRMFEPYFQGRGQGQLAGQLGLGLTIAKEVVEAHGGRIEYHAAHPKGSVFRVILPAAARSQQGGAP